MGEGAFSSLSAGSRSEKSGVRRGVNASVGDDEDPKAFRGGGMFARSMESGGEGDEISIDNMGD